MFPAKVHKINDSHRGLALHRPCRGFLDAVVCAEDVSHRHRRHKVQAGGRSVGTQGYAVAQADAAYKAKDYSAAIGLYRSASAIKATEKYPKDQIELCEKLIRDSNAQAQAEAERQRKEQLAAAQSSFDNKKDFDVPTGQRSDHFLNELAKQYPEGITVENYDSKGKKVKRVIVNRGGLAHEYIEAKYSYGTYYFRDGRSISSQVFYKEAK